MLHYDLLIAGAGPAGLTLAWQVAAKGHKVLLLDPKPAATHVHYLTSGSVIDRERWNIPKRLVHPIDTFSVFSRNESLTIKHAQRYNKWACIIKRPLLLEWLWKKASNAGAEARFNSWPTDVEVSGNRIRSVRWTDHSKRSGKISAELYADCSGIGRAFERHLPIVGNSYRTAVGVEYLVPLKKEPGTVDIYIGSHYRGGYGWLFPLDENKAILGYGNLNHTIGRQAKAQLDGMFKFPRIRSRVEEKGRILSAGDLRTGPVPKQFSRGNLLLVGDTALQANPVLGEGIRFVMDSAGMAAEAVTKALESGNLLDLDSYTVTWKKRFLRSYKWGYRLQRLMSPLTKSDWLLDHLIRRLSALPNPELARLFTGDFNVDLASRIIAECLRMNR